MSTISSKKIHKDVVFVEISNRDVYNEVMKLKEMNKKLEDKLDHMNDKITAKILLNENKITMLQKLMIGAYGFCMTILGWLIAHIMGT